MTNRLGPFSENTIMVGDCLDIMAQMPDGCVDLVVTDPPYNLGRKDDIAKRDDYWPWYQSVFGEVFRVLGEGTAYVFCLPRQMWEVRPLLEEIGFTYGQTLVWYGPNLVRGGHKISLPWTPTWYPILMFWVGDRPKMIHGFEHGPGYDVIKATKPQSNFKGTLRRVHGLQKPVKVVHRLIAKTPGNLVADFFMGSGTTAIAADQLGRNFFGCDISEKSVAMALERLGKDRAARQLELGLLSPKDNDVKDLVYEQKGLIDENF